MTQADGFPENPSNNPKEIVLYVETVSADAYALVGNITKVEAARRLIGMIGELDYSEIKAAAQALEDLERSLRHRLRNEFVQPQPREISRILIEKLKTELTKQITGEKLS